MSAALASPASPDLQLLDLPLQHPSAAPAGLPPRQLKELPLSGPGAVFTELQGRAGESFAPENLADLIFSIAAIGLLQPVLAEELPGLAQDEPPSYRLVLGERRLRSMLWGAANMPGNPHFATLPAIVCRGPLSEALRRRWQLAENIARENLRPGELAAALLLERCATITERLTAAGIAVPPAIAAEENAAERFRLLDELRGDRTDAAAPWQEVLTHLGVAISPRQARALAAAFRALPRSLSEDLDRHQITLGPRRHLARLAGQQDAATEIWAAVKQRGRPDLLAAAITERLTDPQLTPAAAVTRAAVARDAANQARGTRLAARPAGQMIDAEVTGSLLAGLRHVSELLRAGGCVDPYSAGSLRLLALEVARQLAAAEDEPA